MVLTNTNEWKGFWINFSDSITQALFGTLTGYIVIVLISKNNLLEKMKK